MKQVLSLLTASVLGGIIALGGFLFFNPQQAPNEISNGYGQFVKPVNNVNVPSRYGFNVPFDFTEAAAKSTPAVVHIATKGAKEVNRRQENNEENDPWSQFFGLDNPLFGFQFPREGAGSGVIYSADGYIITNNHVVEFGDEFEVTTNDNKKYKAKLVGTYPDGDLAVLKIEAKNLPTMRLANSDEAKIGEWVLAVGNPLDLSSTVTAGIISAKGRDINIIRGQSSIEAFIQTDAAVNPGNSGGALVDAYGRLLGINTAIATKTGFFEGYSFAIPINVVVKIVDDIIKNGSFERGFLGINIADLDDETAKELGLEISQGVLVETVIEGSAAEDAGVQNEDVITEINGRLVKATPDLMEVIGGSKAGETVNLTVNRKGKIQTLPVRLKGATK